MTVDKLRDEIIESQKARTDLIKWKLVLVAAIGAAGLGATGNDPVPVLLIVIPFVCLYVDAVCFHNDLRIFAIARYLRTVKSDPDAAPYEEHCREKRDSFKLEAFAVQGATIVLSALTILVGFAMRKPPWDELGEWVVKGSPRISALLFVSGSAGLTFSWLFFGIYRDQMDTLDGRPGWWLTRMKRSLAAKLRGDELIDVVNADGTPAGIPKLKSHVHRDGDLHRAVHVWIANSEGRLLIQRRSSRKENHPGLWDVSAAGHVKAGETAVECALRETYEELGLRIRADELRHLGTRRESSVLRGGSYTDNELQEIFFVQRDIDLESLRPQRGEVDEVMLVDDLPREGLVPHDEEYSLIAGLPKK